MRIRDSLALDAAGLTLTNDGYLSGKATVARAGNVQQYLGHEIGLTGDDAVKPFGVYRDPDVVFNKDSMLTLVGRPVVVNHPEGFVNAENWKDLAIGSVGGSVAREGEHLVAPMAIMDAEAVQQVQSGERFLSAGYVVDAVPSEGVAADGTPYQYKQSGHVVFNHVALLKGHKPRAGNTKFGDSQIDDGTDRATRWGATPVITKDGGSAMTEKTQIVRDGMSVNIPTADAQIIQRMLADADKAKAAAEKALADEKAEFVKKKAKFDKDDADKDTKIEKLEKEKLTDAALHAMVAELAALTADAKAIAPDVKTDGMAADAIRKAVVTAKLGDAAIADKSTDYITARFDGLTVDAKSNTVDGFRQTVMGGVQQITGDAWSPEVFAAAGMKVGA